MIQQIAKDNEVVTPISREMEGLKEYFPQCFNQQGEFDIDKFREDFPELKVFFRDQLNNQQLRTIIDEVINSN